MKKVLLACVLALSLAACSDGPTAENALADAGYTQIVTTGWSMFGCSENDTFKTGFTAKGPTGRQVKGVVCSGWFKGATIRTF